MRRILVKQVGRKCQVWMNGEMVLESGRVACKGYALGLHLKTGLPYFNVKVNGAEVLAREGKAGL